MNMRSVRSTRSAAAAVLVGAAILAAACSSTTSAIEHKAVAEAGKHGIEVITGELTGAKALAVLNNAGAGVPIVFPVGHFAGVVQTTQMPMPIGMGNVTATSTFTTAAGNLTVAHTNTVDTPPPTKWHESKNGKTCDFTATLETGTAVAVPATSTGKFSQATGHGGFIVLGVGQAPLMSGQATCSFTSVGKVTKGGVTFTATFHGFKVKS
jgi:hypothetical protein